MRKGGDDIEADFFVMVKKSPLAEAVRGNIYREGMRPINANSEDIVISFKAGIDGQFQDGEVAVNVYVPNITYSGTTVKDISRCKTIGTLLTTTIPTFTNGEYNVWLQNIPQSFSEEDIQQHYVSARVRFRRK